VNEGFAMSSFEWVELETLTSDIETARSRLADARKRNNQGAVAMLETEITRAEKRRSQLLAHISTNVATGPEPAARAAAGSRQAAAPVVEAVPEEAKAEPPPDETAAAPEPAPLPDAKDDSNSPQASAPAVEAVPAEAEEEQPLPDRADPVVASGAASPASALKADGVEGGINMWNQLTPNDIERAKHELDVRRADMLARHAEELKGLNTDQSQLETLEQAIASFMQKFSTSPESAVVKLDQERELRQQSNS
jgi:hypothetical protein